MIEIASAVLTDVDVDADLSKGTILESPVKASNGAVSFTDPSAVMEEIQRFCSPAAQGWLLSATHRNPFVLPADAGRLDEVAYPLCGEFCRGPESLHLRQDGNGGWHLTKLIRSDNDGIIKRAKYLRHGGGVLLYEIAATEHQVNGHKETRPHTFRFAGFENSTT